MSAKAKAKQRRDEKRRAEIIANVERARTLARNAASSEGHKGFTVEAAAGFAGVTAATAEMLSELVILLRVLDRRRNDEDALVLVGIKRHISTARIMLGLESDRARTRAA